VTRRAKKKGMVVVEEEVLIAHNGCLMEWLCYHVRRMVKRLSPPRLVLQDKIYNKLQSDLLASLTDRS
jgi:hypothetical protein